MDTVEIVIIMMLGFILYSLNKQDDEPDKTVVYYTDPWPRHYWRRGLRRQWRHRHRRRPHSFERRGSSLRSDRRFRTRP